MPPPPLSPLFPYTTLFRSHRAKALLDAFQAAAATEQATQDQAEHERHRVGFHRLPIVDSHRRFGQTLQRDRKSTRLNSSHLVISYAVFCLKKKKNDIAYTA